MGVLFRSAARASPTATGTVLAAVATTGYFGFLVGPPLIGLAAEATGLSVALGLVGGACGLMTACAGWVSVVSHDRGRRSLPSPMRQG